MTMNIILYETRSLWEALITITVVATSYRTHNRPNCHQDALSFRLVRTRWNGHTGDVIRCERAVPAVTICMELFYYDILPISESNATAASWQGKISTLLSNVLRRYLQYTP